MVSEDARSTLARTFLRQIPSCTARITPLMGRSTQEVGVSEYAAELRCTELPTSILPGRPAFSDSCR
jgi:hypothetical protein